MTRILIVDDQVDIVRIIIQILTDAGYVAIGISDAEELKRLSSESFDLLITDMMMPGKDGIKVIVEMRKRLPKIKILAMSGANWMEKFGPLDVAAGFGVDACIAKPFRKPALLDAVRICLATSDHPISMEKR